MIINVTSEPIDIQAPWWLSLRKLFRLIPMKCWRGGERVGHYLYPDGEAATVCVVALSVQRIVKKLTKSRSG